MTITIDAIYENGTLKLAQPLPLKEHERVRVTVENGCGDSGKTVPEKGIPARRDSADSAKSGQSPTVLPETPSLAEQTAGMMGWKGSAEMAEYFAMDKELEYPSGAEGA